jgi:hypothetical protein
METGMNYTHQLWQSYYFYYFWGSRLPSGLMRVSLYSSRGQIKLTAFFICAAGRRTLLAGEGMGSDGNTGE